MKSLKFAAMGLVALGMTHVASAVTVYITGSTAYRGQTHTAIMHLLGSTNGTSLPSGSTYGYIGGSLSGANAAIFKGTFSSTSVIIKTSWSGSAAGVQTVSGPTNTFTVGYLADGSTTTQSGTSGLSDPRGKGAGTDVAVPQIAFADCYQGSTPFKGTFGGNAYTTLTDNVVGVISFQFVKSKGAAAGITNMTPQLAQATWVGLGYCPLALYTGLPADQGTLVYATGRDPDSGTRITAFAESGVGVFSTVQQYDTGAASRPALYTAQTINGISVPVGEGGESSGGTLAGTGKMGGSSLAESYVSYMSTGDAATLVGNGGATLTYNGVAFSLQAVQQGQYTFWGYEHLMYKPSLSGTPLSFATGLRNQLLSTDGSPLLSSMNVVRGVDGGVVTADY